MICRGIAVVLVAVAPWVGAVETEPGPGTGDAFYCDYATFYRPTAGTACLEVYYAVRLERLTAKPGENGVALYSFNVGAQLRRRADGAVVDEKVVNRTAAVAAPDGTRPVLSVGEFVVDLAPGDYTVALGVGDPAQGRSSVNTMDVDVAPPATGPFISDLELATSVAEAEPGTTGEFVKNGLTVIPNPTKFISDRDPSFAVYFEIYRLAKSAAGADYKVRYEISQANGRRFSVTERAFLPTGPDVARVEDLDVAGIAPGRYNLTVRVSDSLGTELAVRTKEFIVYHEYSAEELTRGTGRFAPYSQEEEKQLRKELSFVASEEELAAFDALAPEEKPIFVDHFWARRDPDKNTPENEFKNEFYARYRYVQERFRTPFREGAATDRGMIYLKFGAPDEIITSPMGMPSETSLDYSAWQSEPFEAWEYYKSGGAENQYVMFVFVDRDGDSDYELDASTLPGYGALIRASGG
jgi:GWxTD domain-containing protein